MAPFALAGAGGGAVTPPTGPKVAVLGDSITSLSRQEIAHRLEGRGSLSIAAVPGRTIAQMSPAVGVITAAGPPFAWVINLGTNDALQRNINAPNDYRDLVAKVAGAPCVVLTTINDFGGFGGFGGFGDAYPIIARALNATIVELAARYPNARVLDWNAVARAHQSDGVLAADGLHPTRAGQNLYAAHLRRALDQCPAPGPVGPVGLVGPVRVRSVVRVQPVPDERCAGRLDRRSGVAGAASGSQV